MLKKLYSEEHSRKLHAHALRVYKQFNLILMDKTEYTYCVNCKHKIAKLKLPKEFLYYHREITVVCKECGDVNKFRTTLAVVPIEKNIEMYYYINRNPSDRTLEGIHKNSKKINVKYEG